MNGILKNILHERSKETIVHDLFDRYTYEDIHNNSEQLKGVEQGSDFPTLPELLFDTFNSFYKYAPKFLEEENIRQDYILNKEILGKAQQTEQFQKLRQITQLDEVNSAVATVSFTEKLMEELEKRSPELKEQIEQIQAAQQEVLQSMQQLAKKTQQLSLSGQNHQKQQLAQAQQKLQQAVQQVKQSVTQASVSQSLAHAAEKTSELNHLMNTLGWGVGGISELKKESPEERMKLAERLLSSDKLFKLVRELGRMKRLAITSQREKIKSTTSELYDLTLGDNIDKIVASELVKIGHPILKKDFLRRYAEKQLLQYSLREREEKGKGPFIVELDLSGSMSGEKEIWAKAVALACLELAVREKRDYSLLTFSEVVKNIFGFNRQNPPTIKDIMKIASENYRGNTNFENPLRRAVEEIETMEKADILFISDGICNISDGFRKSFNDFKMKTKTKVISVLIGAEDDGTLQKFSDKVIEVADFYVGSKEVFENV